METPAQNEHLVIFTYKGHQDRVVVEATSQTVGQEFRRRVKAGEIDEIYSPGTWHYDPESLVPTSGEGE